MSLITLVVTLGLVGVLLWLFNEYVPADGKIKKIVNGVVIVVVVIWLINVFLGGLAVHDIRVPTLK